MNTAKIYHDSEGNECSIMQMVKRAPEWAANRIQEGEKAIEALQKAKLAVWKYRHRQKLKSNILGE